MMKILIKYSHYLKNLIHNWFSVGTEPGASAYQITSVFLSGFLVHIQWAFSGPNFSCPLIQVFSKRESIVLKSKKNFPVQLCKFPITRVIFCNFLIKVEFLQFYGRKFKICTTFGNRETIFIRNLVEQH